VIVVGTQQLPLELCLGDELDQLAKQVGRVGPQESKPLLVEVCGRERSGTECARDRTELVHFVAIGTKNSLQTLGKLGLLALGQRVQLTDRRKRRHLVVRFQIDLQLVWGRSGGGGGGGGSSRGRLS